MSSLQIGRVLLAPPLVWQEQVGDPVTNLGGVPIPSPRSALRHSVDIATLAADGNADTIAARMTLRRQLRSMLNNTPLKLQSFLYVLYSDDAENSGWYVPDQGQLTDGDGSSGLATGFWKVASIVWMLAGHRRTNREARSIWMKDLRTGLYQRDCLGWIYSTDFSALPSLQLSACPNGASQIANAVSGQVLSPVALPTGRDGGICQLVSGLTDLAVVSYERAEAALNLSDVIVYDRRGASDAPAAGPGATWEEVLGPDWPWNWLTAGQPVDAPVLDNGLVRVRYDASVGNPGFRVDAWNGTAYMEQGKMIFERLGGSDVNDDTWVAASLVEYTPDRAVMGCVLRAASDAYSREQVFITLQRGEVGCTFEIYPAPKAAGTQADACFRWAPALNAGVADLNNSIAKVDSQGSGSWTPGAAGTAVYAATAGTGAGTGNSGQFGSLATLGAASFASSENWAAILRCPTAYNVIGPYQATLVLLQGAAAYLSYFGSVTTGYTTPDNSYRPLSQGRAGYLQCQIAFAATQADQIMEAESMTLGANTVTAAVASSSGTGNNATTATRTTDANAHVTRASWPNSFLATYRVFVRVKVSASTGHFYAKTGATTGAAVTTTSTSYVWLDLGDIVANNTTLEIHAWLTAAGTVTVDRVEAILVQDRTRTAAIYSGARDAGQAALQDSRTLGALVAR